MDTAEIIKRIEMRLKEIGMSKADFYEKSGISSATYSQWNTGLFNPSKRKIQAAADALGVSVSYLTNEESEDKPQYYLNDDAMEYAQFLFENPEYKVLFDASRKVKKEDIEFVKQMIDRVRGDAGE